MAWRVENRRILDGDVRPFGAEEVRRPAERVVAHSGTAEDPAAHALADQAGPGGAGELAGVPTDAPRMPDAETSRHHVAP